MCICLDHKYLNDAIKREHHPIPTLECQNYVVLHSYKKLGAKQGYWNVKLDVAPSLMTTFHTPFWRYKFPENAFWVEDESGHLPKEN